MKILDNFDREIRWRGYAPIMGGCAAAGKLKSKTGGLPNLKFIISDRKVNSAER